MKRRAFVFFVLSIMAGILVTLSVLTRGLVHANVQAPANWQVTVVEDEQIATPLDATTRTLYQNAADLISTFTTVPNDRLTYFSAYPNVSQWSGMVTDVQPANNGYVATLIVAMSPGYLISYGSNYSEKYFINAQNTVTYMGFLDPDGTSGQQFDSVSFSANVGP